MAPAAALPKRLTRAARHAPIGVQAISPTEPIEVDDEVVILPNPKKRLRSAANDPPADDVADDQTPEAAANKRRKSLRSRTPASNGVRAPESNSDMDSDSVPEAVPNGAVHVDAELESDCNGSGDGASEPQSEVNDAEDESPELNGPATAAKSRRKSKEFVELSEDKKVKAEKSGATSNGSRHKAKSKATYKEKGKAKVEPEHSDAPAATAFPTNVVSSEPNDDHFVGNAISCEEAQKRYPYRFSTKKRIVRYPGDDEELQPAQAHYEMAKVEGILYSLQDCVLVKGDEGGPDYVGRIVEFYHGQNGQYYFCAQWFYRAQDTAIKTESDIHDPKRVFYSIIQNDNTISCIIKKLNIVQVLPVMPGKKRVIPPCDFYYDYGYDLSYTTFYKMPPVNGKSNGSCSTVCKVLGSSKVRNGKDSPRECSLLDLYAGCGGMSTGLCLGANLSGVKLITRWAVDFNAEACESLRYNHPETQVRHGTADGFLVLITQWWRLCLVYFSKEEIEMIYYGSDRIELLEAKNEDKADDSVDNNSASLDEDEFEVDCFLAIRYYTEDKIKVKNDAGKRVSAKAPELKEPAKGQSGVELKVRWKGYGEDEDTWEPVESLEEGAPEKVKEFVRNGLRNKILPIPGSVDVLCGGPPCQGASGFNRFRNTAAPLDDPKNKQVVVYMNIVEFLKPRHVLMENVVDILKFASGLIGRYAMSRLVHMNYQAKLGIMAAGCYGLPQFRMRVFLVGAVSTESLLQFPLPTHDVLVRGGVPQEWERNIVAYDELNRPDGLEDRLLLGVAISDLPTITNADRHDEMPYRRPPQNDFQKYIRLSKEAMSGMLPSAPESSSSGGTRGNLNEILYDHRSLKLNEDDYMRVCRIPKTKGANFRDLGGVIIDPLTNVVTLDPNAKRELLPSGKPLIPDYAITFVHGRSTKPFGRLWYDETVPTVVTRAEPHNQAILHPAQNRVLSIRENARLQGFPDYYKLFGSVKDRYTQVGNAVAVPVARVLGYALGQAIQHRVTDDSPVMVLTRGFPQILTPQFYDPNVVNPGSSGGSSSRSHNSSKSGNSSKASGSKSGDSKSSTLKSSGSKSSQ